jgi:hypothetical protein
MCVIISRKPGIDIPAAKIESACHVNSDGWGISVLDRGKLITHKEYSSKGNDPERVLKALEQAKDHQVYLHLRYCTVGEKDEDNCHPVKILDQENDGADIFLMHNGTIYDFKSETRKDRSDTVNFAELLLMPIFSAFADQVGGEEVLNEDQPCRWVIESVMAKFIGSSSKVLLYDNLGREIIFNRKDGTEHQGWWSSNTYSFDRTHRDPTVPIYTTTHTYGQGGNSSANSSRTYYGGRYSHYNDGSIWDKQLQRHLTDDEKVDFYKTNRSPDKPDTPLKNAPSGGANNKSATANSNVVALLPWQGQQAVRTTTEFSDKLKQEASQLKETMGPILKHSNGNSDASIASMEPTFRTTYIELLGINSLEELTCLEHDDIQELVDNFQESTTVLIMDLLHELYVRENPHSTKAVATVVSKTSVPVVPKANLPEVDEINPPVIGRAMDA